MPNGSRPKVLESPSPEDKFQGMRKRFPDQYYKDLVSAERDMRIRHMSVIAAQQALQHPQAFEFPVIVTLDLAFGDGAGAVIEFSNDNCAVNCTIQGHVASHFGELDPELPPPSFRATTKFEIAPGGHYVPKRVIALPLTEPSNWYIDGECIVNSPPDGHMNSYSLFTVAVRT